MVFAIKVAKNYQSDTLLQFVQIAEEMLSFIKLTKNYQSDAYSECVVYCRRNCIFDEGGEKLRNVCILQKKCYL